MVRFGAGLGAILGQFGVDVGPIWGRTGAEFGSMSGRFRRPFRDESGSILGYLGLAVGTIWGRCQVDMEPFQGGPQSLPKTLTSRIKTVLNAPVRTQDASTLAPKGCKMLSRGFKMPSSDLQPAAIYGAESNQYYC